jgi:hypothetical protein
MKGNDAKESDRLCGLLSNFNIFCSVTAGELMAMILWVSSYFAEA